MSACKSCGAEIVWVRTLQGGRMPLDADPASDGTIVAAFVHVDGPLGVVLTGEVLAWARDNDATLYRSHFASCPDADEWRRDSRRRTTTEGSDA